MHALDTCEGGILSTNEGSSHQPVLAVALALVLVVSVLAIVSSPSHAEPNEDLFFSGPVIDGPDFCLNFSLGGPVTYPFDSDKDGIADICSLPRTRRAAVARQNALEDLGTEHPDRLEHLFADQCATGPETLGEPHAEPDDECATYRPVVPGTYTAIEAGVSHACVLRADQTIDCWGNNFPFDMTKSPAGQFTAMAAGLYHSCALRTDGAIACWGENSLKQNDAPEGQFTAIAVGWNHSCALRADQTIACWGDNASGQLDPPNGQFTALSSLGGHTCALRIDETITCWGFSTTGGLNAPSGNFAEIAVGTHHSCGIRDNGSIACWGSN